MRGADEAAWAAEMGLTEGDPGVSGLLVVLNADGASEEEPIARANSASACKLESSVRLLMLLLGVDSLWIEYVPAACCTGAMGGAVGDAAAASPKYRSPRELPGDHRLPRTKPAVSASLRASPLAVQSSTDAVLLTLKDSTAMLTIRPWQKLHGQQVFGGGRQLGTIKGCAAPT